MALKAKPFYLNDAQIQWVEDTIRGMTLEEKIGQLFTNHLIDVPQVKTFINTYGSKR